MDRDALCVPNVHHSVQSYGINWENIPHSGGCKSLTGKLPKLNDKPLEYNRIFSRYWVTDSLRRSERSSKERARINLCKEELFCLSNRPRVLGEIRMSGGVRALRQAIYLACRLPLD